MKEFLIQRKDKDFCLIHVSKFEEILRPNSADSEKIEGWGDHRIKIDKREISFSFEEVGIQISFETGDVDNEKAKTIITEICQNVEKEIKTNCCWLQVSD